MRNPTAALLALAALMSVACSGAQQNAHAPVATSQILVTSEGGARQSLLPNVDFQNGIAAGTVITIYPDSTKQTLLGIGTSFTESSAFVLAHLEPDRRRDVMRKIFGASGADFSLARTPIGACDFSVEGRWSYDDQAGDRELAAFSIAPDADGFDPARYPGIRDDGYDLLPMIREALAIKQGQADQELNIIASAWTAPAWMKDIGTWYIPATADNNWQGTGGALRPEHVSTYADYLIRYLDAYADAGVDIWGLTPVNEPYGNGGHWESMAFTPESQNDFIKRQLGPRLRSSRHAGARLLIYDQNRDGLEHWADVVLGDRETRPYVYGSAIHWYASTVDVFEEVLDRVHAKFPDFAIVHTEGCVDNLGTEAAGGAGDPARFRESGWFGNDAFWWNANATDWGYSMEWLGAGAAEHPVYTPVHRYARNLIVSLDHWVGGWVDWNIVLDRDGGPNHVGNFCGAPIMIDTATGDVYYTPIFDVLAQFSRTIRPGDVAVRTRQVLDGLDADALHACATINGDGLLSVQLLNTTKGSIGCRLQIGERYAEITIPPNAVQTVRVALPGTKTDR